MDRVSLDALLAATGGVADGLPANRIEIARIGIDSRTIRQGDLFWAVRGETRDGHDFTADALTKGAIASVVSTLRTHTTHAPRIVVDDSLAALGRFAACYRRQQSATVVGVTGSAGKTTTRSMIHAVLSAAHPAVQSPHNYNNHFGVPLSLLEIESTHRFAVLEMGASRVGEIRELAATAGPNVGVVTTVALAHAETFGNLETIARGKRELIESLPRDGLAVLNNDDPLVRAMRAHARCRTVMIGESDNSDLRPSRIEIDRDAITIHVQGTNYTIPSTGRRLVTAALAAIAIGREFGLAANDMRSGLQSWRPVAGRCSTRRIGRIDLIDDTYNANPASMRAACETLRHWKCDGRRFLVVGDMLELGTYAETCHRELGELAATSSDFVLALGNHAGQIAEGAMQAGMIPSRLTATDHIEEITSRLEHDLQPGDAVLVKGSRGMRMERVIAWLEGFANPSTGNLDESRAWPVCSACPTLYSQFPTPSLRN